VFKFLAASIIGTVIVIGGQADTEPTSSPEPLPTIAYTWTNTPVGDTCDPDTTCEGLEATPSESPNGASLDSNGVEEDGSARYTDGLVYDPETAQFGHNSEDGSQFIPLTTCWVEHKTDLPDELIQGDPQLMPAGSTVVECGTTPASDVPADYYGGTPGGAKCSTDAACSAYTRDHGGEYGYGTSPEKAKMWDRQA
jgi:hypothetical protein